MLLRSGQAESLPYSLSRWTDVPASKWPWFLQRLDQGYMLGVDPRTGIPSHWSLRPEDTLGLVFWTKDPSNLLRESARFQGYRLVVHVTLTGWTEVEKGAPDIDRGVDLLREALRVLGRDKVVWRFSPVPAVPDVVERFERIARPLVRSGMRQVYVAFLQTNDLMSEVRDQKARQDVLRLMSQAVPEVQIRLCAEDKTLEGSFLDSNLRYGVCEDGSRFQEALSKESCGCALAVDPFTVNESCTLGCEYCLVPDVPVLFSDLVWRPISEAQVGSKLIGFDENPPGYRQDRKFREATVEAVWHSKKPTVRITTAEGCCVTTADHFWLSGTRSGWRPTKYLNLSSKLCSIGYVSPLPFTTDYQVGYLTGLSLGDGTQRFEPGQGSSRQGFPQPYWRVAMIDEEPLIRLVEYLASFGIDAKIKPFDSGSPWSKRPMQKVELRSLESLERLFQILEHGSSESSEFQRGFLSGFYDAEGSYSSSLRVSQKDREVLFRVQKYAEHLGFDLSPELREGPMGSSRLSGRIRNQVRFLSTVRPAIQRKLQAFLGKALDTQKVPILGIESGPVQEVIDIQTTTHTFFAAGLATHNCYAADRGLSSKKRNTTKSRGSL